MKAIVEYFEAGCLCILSGGMPARRGNESDEELAARYMRSCVCSRHPDTALGKTAPLHRKVLMYDSAEQRNKREWTAALRMDRPARAEVRERMQMSQRLYQEIAAEALRLENEEVWGEMRA